MLAHALRTHAPTRHWSPLVQGSPGWAPHFPSAAHSPERQAVPAVQGVPPIAPQRKSTELQTPSWHSLALMQVEPALRPQVMLAASQTPEEQTAAAESQVPSWRPSLGIAVPLASIGLQASALRSQKLPLGQSVSSQQPLLEATQWPSVQALLTH